MGILVVISVRNRKLIDFERAMKYSLATIPLCNLDGTMRRTSIGVLMKEALANLCKTTQLDRHVDSWRV